MLTRYTSYIYLNPLVGSQLNSLLINGTISIMQDLWCANTIVRLLYIRFQDIDIY